MTISPARLAANQANAAKSTGPTSEAGKKRSRANAVKHGLRSVVVPIADEATIRARAAGVIETIRPQTEFQLWYCVKIAQTMIQVDRLGVLERQVRADAAHRAEVSWDEDQQAEANRVGARLSRNPEQTVGQLRRTVAGCDWLIDRWSKLADSAGRQSWTDTQQTLAHDLIGTPPEFRDNAPTHLVDDWGRAVVPAPTETELARMYLDELREQRENVVDDDEVAQARAAADLNDFGNRDIQRIRRHDRSFMRQLDRAFALSQHESPRTVTDPRLLKSIPAHFFDPPVPAPPEPVAPPEPRPEPAPIAPNEPKLEPVAITPPEPRPIAPPVVPPESTFALPLLFPPAPSGLSPELMAILEAGLPNPDTLEPAWCRQFIAANLGIDPARLLADPAPPDAADPDGGSSAG